MTPDGARSEIHESLLARGYSDISTRRWAVIRYVLRFRMSKRRLLTMHSMKYLEASLWPTAGLAARYDGLSISGRLQRSDRLGQYLPTQDSREL